MCAPDAVSALERLAAEGGLTAEAVQRLLACAVRAYAAKVREEGSLAPFPAGGAASATEVATLCLALLRAVDMDIFELQMWQSLGRCG